MSNKILGVEITSEAQRNQLVKQLQEMEFKKKLPKIWGELESIEGYWVDEDSEIEIASLDIDSYSEDDLNVFKTEKQAKKALAMAQLSQLMAVYNDGWEPDWSNVNEKKYCIFRDYNSLSISEYTSIYKFLAFKDREIVNEFFNNFKPLIKQFFEISE